MTGGWRLSITALAVLAAGCSSALTPFATAPVDPKPGVDEGGARVAICYNGYETPPEQVRQLAQAECASRTVAERVDTDYRMDDCPLMTPGRATFVCKAAK